MSGSVSVEEPGGRRSGSDREVTRCEMGRPRPGWREAAAGMKGGGGGGEERASRERERAREDLAISDRSGSGGRRGMERNAVAISEKRGRARDFSSVAGDWRSRKRVRDQAQIAGRLCGIICLLAQKLSKRCPKQALFFSNLLIWP